MRKSFFPPSVICHPSSDLVPGVGFEPTSPRLRRGAFTRLASQASEDGGQTTDDRKALLNPSSVVRSLSSDWRKAEESNL